MRGKNEEKVSFTPYEKSYFIKDKIVEIMFKIKKIWDCSVISAVRLFVLHVSNLGLIPGTPLWFPENGQ